MFRAERTSVAARWRICGNEEDDAFALIFDKYAGYTSGAIHCCYFFCRVYIGPPLQTGPQITSGGFSFSSGARAVLHILFAE